MSDIEIEPVPGIVISDHEESMLPLQTFQIICVVENDPESYMSFPEDSEKLEALMNEMLKRFSIEVDSEGSKFDKRSNDQFKPTDFVWLYCDSEDSDVDINYFRKFAEVSNAKVKIKYWGNEDTENIKFFLQGVFCSHPDWQIAVIGSMFEDEVMTIANLSKGIGFATTILTRYCLSKKAFIDSDNVMEYRQWVLHAEKMKKKSENDN